MGMTIDDMYDWLYRLKSELVVYMPKEWHEPMRCSIQDAITFSRKYQMLKADYENRLNADMVAMLKELDDKIMEEYIEHMEADWHDIIQQKINALRGGEDGKNNN